MQINRFVLDCFNYADKSQCRMTHSAGLIINGNLRHISCNYYGSNPLEPAYGSDNCTTHAEVATIYKGIKNNDLFLSNKESHSSKGQKDTH